MPRSEQDYEEWDLATNRTTKGKNTWRTGLRMVTPRNEQDYETWDLATKPHSDQENVRERPRNDQEHQEGERVTMQQSCCSIMLLNHVTWSCYSIMLLDHVTNQDKRSLPRSGRFHIPIRINGPAHITIDSTNKSVNLVDRPTLVY